MNAVLPVPSKGLPSPEANLSTASFPFFDILDLKTAVDATTRAAVVTHLSPETLAHRDPLVIRSLIDELWGYCRQRKEQEVGQAWKQERCGDALSAEEDLLFPAVITLLHAEAIALSPKRAVDEPHFGTAPEELLTKNRISAQLDEIIDPSRPIPPDRYVSTGLSTDGKHIFVVPDIHGNYELLHKSLDYIGQQLRAQDIDPKNVVLVQLGDIINKGPESAKALGVMNALKGTDSSSSLSRGEATGGSLCFDSVVKNLGLSGIGEVALLRGNHEDLGNLGMHLNSDAPIDDYARDTSDALFRYGLRETVLSVIRDYPDAFSPEDARWLTAAVESFPIRGNNDDGWSWNRVQKRNAEGAPTQEEVRTFFDTFRSIWGRGLEESRLSAFAASLKPAHRVGDFVFTHAGPPKDAQHMRSLQQHLEPNGGNPLPQHTLDHILNDHSASDKKLLEKITAALGPASGLSSVPAGFVFGHTPGGCFELSQSSAPLLAIGLDLGVGSSGLALPLLHINPDGRASILLALRSHDGIVPVAVNPARFLPPAGHSGLPARAPILRPA